MNATNIRRLSLVVGVACWAASAAAQEPTKAKDAKPAPKEPVWSEFTVTPQEVAEQRLKYRLFPDHVERVPGNAAPILLRQAWEKNPAYWERLARAEDFLKQPLSKFSAVEARKEVVLPSLSELRRAAYRSEADWQYPLHEERLDMILLPDAQLRWLLRALAAHCRADNVEGKIDEAMDKITVGLGVAAHYGKAPFGVCKLVQCSIANTMLDRVEELSQAPRAPNLYWALALLPNPFAELRPTIDWERRMLPSAVPEVKDMSRRRSEKEWGEVFEQIIEAMRFWDNDFYQATKEAAGRTAFKAKFVPSARAELGKLDARIAADLAAMSDAEVSVRYFTTRYLRQVDEGMAALALPPPMGLAHVQRTHRQLKQRSQDVPGLRSDLHGQGLYVAVWSLQRRIAALQAVEALRDYAGRSGGKLPEGLADVVETPVPPDPLTGRPFGYRLADGAAEITAEAIDVEGERRYGIRWRIRLRK